MDPAVDRLPLSTDPVWPWSLPGVGWPALAVVALLLLGAAVWSYLRVPGASFRRVSVVLGLRLLALLLVFLSLAGASCVSQKDLKVPSRVIVLLDLSESMAVVKDETASRSRFDEMKLILKDAQPVLAKLARENNITTVFYRFGDETAEMDLDGLFDGSLQATGKRTDTAQALRTIHDRFRGEKYLRAMLLLSDGADNVASDPPARNLAAAFRTLPCPIHTFAFGNRATTSSHNDIVVTSLNPEPSVVSVKGKLTVRATVDALGGFVGSEVRVKVFLDNKEVSAKDLKLERRKDNQIEIVVDAPPVPGEIKVTLRVEDPNRPGKGLPDELTDANNEMSTYVTVSQEGLSVLLIERLDRFPEPQRLLEALAADRRIRVYRAWLSGKEVVTEDGKSLLDFDQQPYDVIILGDVTAERLRDADPKALEKIADRVNNKRTGLLMMGGRYAFGNGDWAGTEIELLLPVLLDGKGQNVTRVKIRPTAAGLEYVMRLADSSADSERKWEKLGENGLNGYTPLGTVKDGSIRMAETSESQQPLLVGRNVGTGRTMAFAGDTTYRWVRPKNDGGEIHSRFWRQVVLWLARREQTDDNLRIRLATRRLRTGDNLGFSVELQGKQGETIRNGKFDVKVVDPKGAETPLEVIPDPKGSATETEHRGRFVPKLPGEYRVVATGSGKDPSGKNVDGKNEARFLAYQDDAESSEKAANPDFLKDLAAAGGGQDHRPGELKKVLERLPSLPLPTPPPKPAKFPDWRQSKGTSPFLLAFLLLFVQVLALEWFLRRRWGMV